MKYWPVSVIKSSPLMPAALVHEFRDFYNTPLSEAAFQACAHVAAGTQPQEHPNLYIIDSDGAPYRQIYLNHPSEDEFARLERGGVIPWGLDGEDFMMIIDALH